MADNLLALPSLSLGGIVVTVVLAASFVVGVILLFKLFQALLWAVMVLSSSLSRPVDGTSSDGSGRRELPALDPSVRESMDPAGSSTPCPWCGIAPSGWARYEGLDEVCCVEWARGAVHGRRLR